MSSEEILRKKHAKGTKHEDIAFPDIKQKVPEKQLAKIGALALAFNELEAILDQLFFVIIGVEDYLQFEVSTRINEIDGKIGIINEGLRHLLQEDDADFLSVALGEGEFGLYKKFRDGAIHIRHLNVETGLGLQVKSQGDTYSFLVREDILDAAYELIVALSRELSSVVYLLQSIKKLNGLGSDDPKSGLLPVQWTPSYANPAFLSNSTGLRYPNVECRRRGL